MGTVVLGAKDEVFFSYTDSDGLVEKSGVALLAPKIDSKTKEIIEDVAPTVQPLAHAVDRCTAPDYTEVPGSESRIDRFLKRFHINTNEYDFSCPAIKEAIGELTPQSVAEIFDPASNVVRLALDFSSEDNNA